MTLSLTLVDTLAPGGTDRRIEASSLPLSIGSAEDCDVCLHDTELADARLTLRRNRAGKLWLKASRAMLRRLPQGVAYSEIEVWPGQAVLLGTHQLRVDVATEPPLAPGQPSGRARSLVVSIGAALLFVAAPLLDKWLGATETLTIEACLPSALGMLCVLACLLLLALGVDKLCARPFDAAKTLARLSIAGTLALVSIQVLDLLAFALGMTWVSDPSIVQMWLWSGAMILVSLWPTRGVLRRWWASRNLIPVATLLTLIVVVGIVVATRDEQRIGQSEYGPTYAPTLRLISPEGGASVLMDLQGMHAEIDTLRSEAPPLPPDD